MKIRKPSRKTTLISLTLLILIIVVIVKLSGSGEKLTSVQADLAIIDDISEIVTASGRVQPQTKVDIVAEVSAQIVDMYVVEGDVVRKGQTLILLDTVQLKSDVAQARFSLDELTARAAAARTQFDKDRLEYDRQAKLYEQKLSSESEYTDAQFAYESSHANYEAMLAQVKTGQALLEKVEDNLTKTTITAPMNGVVTYMSAEIGEIAQAQTSYTQGKTLMTISDLSVFEVEVDVDETEIAKLDTGQASEIRVDAYPDTVFAGTVIEIGNSATVEGQGTDNYSTSFRVKVRFDETERSIRPGMSATVDITTAKVFDALLIPYAALVTREFDLDSLMRAETVKDDGGSLIAEVQASELNDTTTSNEAQENNVNDKDAEKKFKKSKKIKKSGVYRCIGGQAKFIEVTTGIADEQNIVALSGVNPGDTIISGSFQTLRKLAEGEKVQLDERSLEKINENKE
ncbi:MAG: efflux RND transporter periplasmic adaptor subunit [Candidatus Zixiibacteriota bacterium]